MSQNPFMSVEENEVPSSTNPFMGITLEDSDFEQTQEFFPEINIPEGAFAGYVPGKADLAQDLELRARTVAETFPDTLSAVELSNKTGIPVSTVLENHKEISKSYDAVQNGPTRRAALEKMIRDEPITGRWLDRKSTRLNSSHPSRSRMPSSA